jgi:hypothetical protein
MKNVQVGWKPCQKELSEMVRSTGDFNSKRHSDRSGGIFLFINKIPPLRSE